VTSASPPRHRGSVTALDWRLLADGELGPPQKLPGLSLAAEFAQHLVHHRWESGHHLGVGGLSDGAEDSGA
jgi:hypothetical protein